MCYGLDWFCLNEKYDSLLSNQIPKYLYEPVTVTWLEFKVLIYNNING